MVIARDAQFLQSFLWLTTWKKYKKGAQKRVSLDIKHVMKSANILHVMVYWDVVMFKFKTCTVHERKPEKIVLSTQAGPAQKSMPIWPALAVAEWPRI